MATVNCGVIEATIGWRTSDELSEKRNDGSRVVQMRQGKRRRCGVGCRKYVLVGGGRGRGRRCGIIMFVHLEEDCFVDGDIIQIFDEVPR